MTAPRSPTRPSHSATHRPASRASTTRPWLVSPAAATPGPPRAPRGPAAPALARLARRRPRPWTAGRRLPDTVVHDPRGGAPPVRLLAGAMEDIRERIPRDPEDHRHRRISRAGRVL